MTKPLPHGTVNLSLNVPKEYRRIVGKLAFDQDISINSYILRKLGLGIAQTNPRAAKDLARIRRERLKATASAVGIFLVISHAFLGGSALRARSFRAWKARQEFDMTEAA